MKITIDTDDIIHLAAIAAITVMCDPAIQKAIISRLLGLSVIRPIAQNKAMTAACNAALQRAMK